MYDDDLAHIHDSGFAFHSQGLAPGLLQWLREWGLEGGHVLDLACGSGIWAAKLTRAGYRVTGIDQSTSMVGLARRAASRGRFRTGSLWEAALPACDAITILGEGVNYLGPGRPPSVRRLARRLFTALAPGGLLFLDAAGPGRFRPPARRFWEDRDWALLAAFREDRVRRRLTRDLVTFRREGGSWRRHTELHTLRLFPPAELAGALRQAGFRVRLVRTVGAYRLPRGLHGYLARRPD